MSNHFSAANLKSPGGDPRLDFTDLFAFQAPRDPGKTVLIADYCPFRDDQLFHPDAIYRINIDNDGDAQADIAFTLTFSELANGTQTGTLHHATGVLAREPGPTGHELTASIPVSFDAMARPVETQGIRVFAGVRSEPFFADVEGALHGFQWTGHDDFAGNNVLSIALEVPDEMLGTAPVIGVWASISRRR
jgi:hypothetical protein